MIVPGSLVLVTDYLVVGTGELGELLKLMTTVGYIFLTLMA